jgi:hypothetical protein
MDEVRLHFVDTSGVPQTVQLPVVVVHMPKPRHALVEPSDTPIFDQLLDEVWPRNYTLF